MSRNFSGTGGRDGRNGLTNSGRDRASSFGRDANRGQFGSAGRDGRGDGGGRDFSGRNFGNFSRDGSRDGKGGFTGSKFDRGSRGDFGKDFGKASYWNRGSHGKFDGPKHGYAVYGNRGHWNHGGWGGWNGGWGWGRPGWGGWYGYRGFPWWAFAPGFGWGWGYGLGWGLGWCYPYGGWGYGGYGGWGGYGDGYYAGGYGTSYYADSTDAATATAPTTDPAAADDFIATGEAAFRAGQYDQAMRDWQHAMVDNPDNGGIVLLMAQALFQLGQYEAAAGAVQSAMQMLPESEWNAVVKNYADLYGDIGQYTTQLKALEKARDEKPDDPAIRFLLGYHFGYLGYPKQAVRELDKAIDLEPRDLGAQKLRDDFAVAAGLPARPHAAEPESPDTPAPPAANPPGTPPPPKAEPPVDQGAAAPAATEPTATTVAKPVTPETAPTETSAAPADLQQPPAPPAASPPDTTAENDPVPAS